jgi:hypothetical protein
MVAIWRDWTIMRTVHVFRVECTLWKADDQVFVIRRIKTRCGLVLLQDCEFEPEFV